MALPKLIVPSCQECSCWKKCGDALLSSCTQRFHTIKSIIIGNQNTSKSFLVCTSSSSCYHNNNNKRYSGWDFFFKHWNTWRTTFLRKKSREYYIFSSSVAKGLQPLTSQKAVWRRKPTKIRMQFNRGKEYTNSHIWKIWSKVSSSLHTLGVSRSKEP